MFSANELAAALALHVPRHLSWQTQRYLVALSGGADSGALLAGLCELRDRGHLATIRAVHVNHGLQAEAGKFEAACDELCARFSVALTVVALRVETLGRSVEEAARDARYAALGAQLAAQECMLSAHHAQDQAETFLLQALRGAGLRGLAAMPYCRSLGTGWHLRPLLQVARADLRAYGRRRGVQGAHDPMNDDARFDRAYIRNRLWPLIEHRWPAAAPVLARSAAHVASAAVELAAMTRGELAQILDGEAISLERLRRLMPARQLLALRAFIESHAAKMPSTQKLQEALRQLLQAAPHKNPAVTWQEWALRRYRSRVYLTAAVMPALHALDWPWQQNAVCALGKDLGQLRIEPRLGGLRLDCLSATLQIRARRGGERLELRVGAGSREVRQLFQEQATPPWVRASVPFIFSRGELLCVADGWVNAQFRVPADQPGVAFVWDGVQFPLS